MTKSRVLWSGVFLAGALAVGVLVWRFVQGVYPWQTPPSAQHLEALISEGKYAQAEAYGIAALDWSERVHGDDHATSLKFLCALPAALLPQDKNFDAQTYIDVALSRLNTVHGPDHQETIEYLLRLGSVLQEQGRLTDADLYLSQAMESARRARGDEDPLFLRAFVAVIGNRLPRGAACHECAMEVEQALERCRRVVGERHELTVKLMILKAMQDALYGRAAQGVDTAREAVALVRQMYTRGSPEVVSAEFAFGLALIGSGAVEESAPFIQAAHQTTRRYRYGHPWRTLSHVAFAALLLEQGNAAEAMRECQAALDECARFTCPPMVRAMILLTMAGAQSDLGNHAEAEAVLRQLLDRSNPQSSEFALVRTMATSVLCQGLLDQERLEEANSACVEAVELHTTVLGETHPQTLYAIDALARVHLALGDHHRAEGLWRTALDGLRGAGTDSDADRVEFLSGLAFAIGGQGRLDEAERHFREAAKIAAQVDAVNDGAEHLTPSVMEAKVLDAVARAGVRITPDELLQQHLPRILWYANRAVELTQRKDLVHLTLLAYVHGCSGDRAAAAAVQLEALELAWQTGASDEEIAILTQFLNDYRTGEIPR